MTRTRQLLAGATVLALCAGVAQADTGGLGLVPFVGTPPDTYSEGAPNEVVWGGSTRHLTLDVAALMTTFGPGDQRPHGQGSRLMIDVVIRDGFAYDVGRVPGHDLILTGDLPGVGNGTLLTGEVRQVGFVNANEPGADRVYMRFRPTGGRLSSSYHGRDIGVVMTLAGYAVGQDWPNGATFDTPAFAPLVTRVDLFPAPCGGRVGDLIWYDADLDGIQGLAEPGINGVEVSLSGTDLFGNSVDLRTLSMSRDGHDGYYEFPGLCESDQSGYVLSAATPQGMLLSPELVGTNRAIDSDGLRPDSTHSAATIVLQGPGSNPTVDFGFGSPCTGEIGDRVWLDQGGFGAPATDGNGIQDPGEPGIPNTRVGLTGPVARTTFTDGNGRYHFVGLCEADYQLVTTDLSADKTLTAVHQGSDPAADSEDLPAFVTLATDRTIDQTVDFGFVSPCRGQVGSRVFYDRNQDGIQDPDLLLEPGIFGVTLVLRDAGPDAVLRTPDDRISLAVTDATGSYAFFGLCPGGYSLSVLPLAGYEPTLVHAPGSDPANDSNDHLGDDFVLGQDEVNDTVDFGYQADCQGQIGDFIWNDLDHNGIQDPQEPGFEGVVVSLVNPFDNTVLAFQTTGADGRYLFANRCPGTHTVRATPPPRVAPAPVGQGTTDDDSNPNPSSVSLAAEDSQDSSVDFGFTQLVDLELTKTVDNTSPPVGSEVTFTLTIFNNNAPPGVSTATGVRVQDVLPAGLQFVSASPAAEFDSATGIWTVGSLTPDASKVLTITATFTTAGTEVNYAQVVAADQPDVDSAPNNNPGPTPSEDDEAAVTLSVAPVAIQIVKLTNGTDNNAHPTGPIVPIGSPVTWTYLVTNTGVLPLAFVEVTDDNGGGAGFSPTYLSGDTNADDRLDTDETWIYTATLPAIEGQYVNFASALAFTPELTAVAFDNDEDRYFGQPTADLSVSKTDDMPSYTAGTQTVYTMVVANAGPSVMTGASVVDNFPPEITSATWNCVASVGSGCAAPNGAGDINTTVDLLVGGTATFVVTAQIGVGAALNLTNKVTVAAPPGAIDLTLGNNTATDTDTPNPVSIGGRVWSDVDGDGVQDAGEPGLTPWTVTISGANLPLGYPAVQPTGANGLYSYADLPPGTYTVCVTPQPGYQQTFDIDGLATPHCSTLTVAAGQNRNDVDFGYQELAALAGRVWSDVDGDGVQDAGEPGLTPWEVTISGANLPAGYPAVQLTGGNGLYSYADLPPGTYTVCVTPQPGYQQTFDIDGLATPHCATASVAAGETRNGVDFGYQELAALAGRVWSDVDGDGVQDAGEPGLTPWEVTISGANLPAGYPAVQLTGGNGLYSYADLPPGTYTVCVTPQAGYQQTFDIDGLATPNCSTLTVAAGETRNGVDFGYQELAALAGRVWSDVDGDGVQDAGEPGLTPWEVTISGANLPAGYPAVQATGANGLYSYANLPPGTYTACVTPLAGYQQTFDIDGLATPNCSTLTVAAGEVRNGVDFGYQELAALAGRVWSDVDGDGVQDAGEPGLTPWEVTISGANLPAGYPAVQATGANGLYSYASLPPGTYTACVTPLAGYRQTFDIDGLATPNCATVTIVAGETRNGVDFGYQELAALAGRVWSDVDGDSVQDAGEPGLTPWTVTISGANLPAGYPAVQLTGANGLYSYADLPAGTYTVCVTPMAGYRQTFDIDGLATPNCSTLTVAAGETRNGVDFGYQELAALAGRVWSDINGNGAQDGGEPGLTPWTVTISGANLPAGYPAVQLTGANGLYSYADLPAGTYTVCVTPQPGYQQTFDIDGLATPNCSTLTVAAGETRNGVDFGYQELAALAGRVWSDVDGDGVQDAGEPGLTPWEVTISGANLPAGYPAVQLTGGNGLYSYADLPPGTYTVCVTPQAGYQQTFDIDGLATPNCSTLTVAAGETRNGVDFGYQQLAALAGRVWSDVDGDGVQDAGEPGLTPWTVAISGANLPAGYPAVQLTGGNGLYSYADLPPGTYTVCVTPQAGYQQTFDIDGLATPNCSTLTVAAGETRNGVDFGYQELAALAGRVWSDVDGDGVQDAGEPGLTPWTVTISGANLPAGYPAAQMTGANGLYSYANLPAGTYTVCVTPMAGYRQTFDIDGLATPNCSTVIVAAGESRTGVDYGYQQLAALAGRVWSDVDGDGVQDAGEPGLTPWAVTISGANLPAGYPAAQMTGANGLYSYPNLLAGTYTVCVTPMAGYRQTFDIDGLATPNCSTLTIAAGEARNGVDFGYQQLAAVAGRVWSDVDGDGVQDAGEPGLTPWEVTISGANLPAGYPAAQMTGANGLYSYPNLPPGTYTVCVTPQAGYRQTFDIDGLATPNCSTLTVAAGETRNGVDFGYQQLAALAGRVWSDVDGDGVQDAGEPGLTPWTVTISGANLPAGYPAVQATGANGLYSYLNLPPGTYTVCVTPMAGYRQTFDIDGLATPNCSTLTVAAGETRNGVDYGYQQLAAIAGRVWSDINGNGAQDGGEPGLTPWTVTISGANLPAGYPAVQATGANGLYSYPNLPAGTYTVCVTPMAGYRQTFDIDGLATPNCSTLTVAAGESRANVDFGYQQVASLAGRVWSDLDGDGVQDAGEPGLTPWTVTISGASLPAGYPAVQLTGANGLYSYANLPAGTYTVRVTPQAGYRQTFDVDGLATAHQATVTVAAGENRTGVDFGYQQLASLAGRVWSDFDGDGVQDVGEPGLTPWTVTISGANLPAGYPAAQMTGANGLYSYANLPPGSYTVCVTPLAGYQQTFDIDGLATPHCATVTVAAGETRAGVDFGYRLLAPPGMTIVKSASPTTVAPYQQVTYTYVVTNTGGTILTNIVVTDDNGTPSYTADDFTVGTIASLSPGASASLTATLIPVVSYKAVFGSNPPAGAVIVVSSLLSGAANCAGAPGPCYKITYLQDFGINDNTYGTGQIGWNNKRFTQLVGSDKLELQLKDMNGNVVLDFFLDYLSAVPLSPQFPAGYASLCAAGGDGSLVFGNASNIIDCWTSQELNLNHPGNLPNRAALIVDSPTSLVSGNVVIDPALAPGGWDHINSYTVVIKAGVFPGNQLGSVSVPNQHNSPNKIGAPNDMATMLVDSTVINTATATTGSLSATATATVNVVMPTPGADLSITKDDGVTSVAAGGQTIYTIRVTNVGPLSVTGARLHDPDNADLVEGNPVCTTAAGNRCTSNPTLASLQAGTLALPTLASGQFYEISLPAIVAASAGSTLTNTATVSSPAGGPSDPTQSNNSAADTDSVGQLPACLPGTFGFSGSDPLSGTLGNIKAYSINGVNVKVSGWRRNKAKGTFHTAYVGAYSGGLGVTDSTEGDGSNNRHTIDNNGSEDNYLLFEFDRAIVPDEVYLGFVSDDSDLSVWYGNAPGGVDPYATHQALSATLLSGLETETNAGGSSSRWADINSSAQGGNLLVVAAKIGDSQDYFKLSKLKFGCSSTESPLPIASCSALKPIDAIVLKAPAAGVLNVDWYRDKVSGTNPGSADRIGSSGPIPGNAVFSFDGFAAASAKNDVDFVVTLADGTKVNSRFHRSCSDDDMDDAADCGKLQGDGKKNDVYPTGNIWKLVDLLGNGKHLMNCTP